MAQIWVLAKERLTTEEMKNAMLLRTDREGRNAWVNAAFGGKVEAMRDIWELAN